MIKRYDFTYILGWSISRYDMFSLCRRKYYYSYYGKHDPEVPFERIRRLKDLTSVPMETGRIFHEMADTLLRRFLKSDAELDRANFFDYAERLTEDSCSAQEFAKVYFGELDAIDPGPINERVQTALENFLGSERYRWVIEEAMSVRDQWVIEPETYGETRIGGIKAYCNFDFLVPLAGAVHIIDWKAGKQDERKYGRQLLAYATGAAGIYGVGPEQIEAVVAYVLPKYTERRLALDGADIAGFVETVRRETEEMRALCADVEQNLPLEKEQFPMTGRRGLCGYCEFRELCGS